MAWEAGYGHDWVNPLLFDQPALPLPETQANIWAELSLFGTFYDGWIISFSLVWLGIMAGLSRGSYLGGLGSLCDV